MKKLTGFTLIELMIVIAVFGIIAAVVIPIVNPEQNKSQVDVPVRKPIPTRDSPSNTQTSLDGESIHKISNDGPIFACVDGKLYLNAVYMNKGCDIGTD